MFLFADIREKFYVNSSNDERWSLFFFIFDDYQI